MMAPVARPAPMARRCVYTAIFGGYERLNEQPEAARSEIPFLCLTDDPELRSETWQIRLVAPEFGMDPHRSQRDVKIRPHRHLPDFEQSLYIDNTVLLTQPPERVFEAYNGASGFTVFPHSYRDTALDEFLEVARDGLDDPSRIFEQLNHYFAERPDVLQEKPYWGGILMRTHTRPAVVKAMETWVQHVFRYSRRDQLSLNFALRQAGLAPHAPEVDNHTSWFHSWPHPTQRRADMRRFNGFALIAQLAQARSLETRSAEEAARRAALEAERAAFEECRATWRAGANERALQARLGAIAQGLGDSPPLRVGWRKALSGVLHGRMGRIIAEASERARVRLAVVASGLFDAAWYAERNPDVAGVDPLDHYLDHGGAEGRAPGPDFDGRWYLETYPDLALNGVNPLVHFLRYGYREGRRRAPAGSWSTCPPAASAASDRSPNENRLEANDAEPLRVKTTQAKSFAAESPAAN
jgi:hypothetical protein